MKKGYTDTQEFSDIPTDNTFSGQCLNAEKDTIWIDNKKYALSKKETDYWSAIRFCNQLNKRVPFNTELGCSKVASSAYCINEFTQKIQTEFPQLQDIWLYDDVKDHLGWVWSFNFARLQLVAQQPKQGGHSVLNNAFCID